MMSETLVRDYDGPVLNAEQSKEIQLALWELGRPAVNLVEAGVELGIIEPSTGDIDR